MEGGSVGRGVGGAGVALGCVRRRLGEESSLVLEVDFLGHLRLRSCVRRVERKAEERE